MECIRGAAERLSYFPARCLTWCRANKYKKNFVHQMDQSPKFDLLKVKDLMLCNKIDLNVM